MIWIANIILSTIAITFTISLFLFISKLERDSSLIKVNSEYKKRVLNNNLNFRGVYVKEISGND